MPSCWNRGYWAAVAVFVLLCQLLTVPARWNFKQIGECPISDQRLRVLCVTEHREKKAFR